MRTFIAGVAALLTLGAASTAGCTATPVAAPASPVIAASTATVTTVPDWPTYHGNSLRTGYSPTLKAVTRTPALIWNVPLDGAVYGSPIVAAGGLKFVATENNSVYRIQGNRVIWRRHLGAPVPLSSLPCGNINPLGITSTPAYDASTHTLVVVGEFANPFRHVAVGLDPVSGAQRWFRRVDVPSTVGITPQAMQQRGALLISGRRVYVPYGGLAGDCSSYRGSVVGLDLDHPTTTSLWHFTVPTPREGGIWAPPGPVENPGGGILVSVGNGAIGSSGSYDYSDSVLKLAFQRIYGYFSPSSWRSDNNADADLGSQSPAIVGNFVFQAGKSGTAYVLNRSSLGGIGGQVSSANVCRSFGGTAVVGNVVYVPCTDGVRAVRINSNGTMSVLWHSTAAAGSPVVGGGRVFVLDTANGILRLLSPSTGATITSLSVGSVSRFATPALWSNAVLVGTLNGIKAWNW